jgi:hypothetical protein
MIKLKLSKLITASQVINSFHFPNGFYYFVFSIDFINNRYYLNDVLKCGGIAVGKLLVGWLAITCAALPPPGLRHGSAQSLKTHLHYSRQSANTDCALSILPTVQQTSLYSGV